MDVERAAPEAGDRRADLDGTRPAQLLQEVDLDPHEDESGARKSDAQIGLAEHRDPSGLEIGGEDRVVDVPLRIEIGIADEVAHAMREVVETRGRSFGGPVV